jgi:hypothetical protein
VTYRKAKRLGREPARRHDHASNGLTLVVPDAGHRANKLANDRWADCVARAIALALDHPNFQPFTFGFRRENIDTAVTAPSGSP